MIPCYGPDTIDHACPHVAACRAQALRDLGDLPGLAARFADDDAHCKETDPAKAARCAAMLGLARPADDPQHWLIYAAGLAAVAEAEALDRLLHSADTHATFEEMRRIEADYRAAREATGNAIKVAREGRQR